MRNCVIFCAGAFHGLAEPVEGTVIAADGGLRHLGQLALTADVIIGDFDSLGYVPQNANVFPVEKDDTDAMLAVRKGLELGCDRFVLYGALEGPRLDHTVANFQTLQFLADRGAQGFLVGKDTVVTVIKNGSLVLPALQEGIVSVFCMGRDAAGVTIEGLQYPLENGILSAGFPLGVSNHFVGQEAKISVEDGSLLVLYPIQVGLI
jgi:thiamine pyrophosphokinase